MATGHARVTYAVQRGERLDFLSIDRYKLTSRILRSLSLFERINLPVYIHYFGENKTQPRPEALDALAEAMTAPERQDGGDGDLPAGYTYLGQFVFHDITAMSITEDGVQNRASAALDLRSVLGDARRPAEPAPVGSPGPLRIGETMPGFGAPPFSCPLACDLPRKPRLPAADDSDRYPAGFPLVPDTRNEGFLQLAQLHLAFIKFYNTVTRLCREGGSEAAADQVFIEHVQWVVLHDYLRQLLDPDIYRRLADTNRRQVIRPDAINNAHPFLVPIEFAAAAGRYGHSMIRDDYEWNCLRAGGRAPSLTELMEVSHLNSPPNTPKLLRIDRDWVVDWRRLFDFGPDELAGRPAVNKAKKIDTHLAATLAALPESVRNTPPGSVHAPPGATFNLAKETLRRQAQLSLATAQQIIDWIARMRGTPDLRPLRDDELVPGDSAALDAVFRTYPELISATPIWYYVLREAEVRTCGRRLGRLGSILVGETIHAAIEASDVSILHQAGWRPRLPSSTAGTFTMLDLLSLAGDLNPLECQ